MPWPELPPDPDMPRPALKYGSSLVAFGLRMRGLRPHDEQARLDLRMDLGKGAMWLPFVEDATAHVYRGVGIGKLQGATSIFPLTSTWTPKGASRTDHFPIQEAEPLAKVEAVAARRERLGVSLKAKVDLGTCSECQLVVAPVEPRMPTFDSHHAYAAAGAWRLITQEKPVVRVLFLPGEVDFFAVFVARGFPEDTEVLSAVTTVRA